MTDREKKLQLDLLSAYAPDQQFTVRESKRARQMAINIGPHGVVEVVVPRNSRPRIVQAFVSRHQSWINRAVQSYSSQSREVCREMPALIELTAIDRSWKVEYGSQSLQEKDELIRIPAVKEDWPECRRHLHRWLKTVAKQTFGPRLKLLADESGFSYKRVQVRGQKTRWGSYSSSGTLSLNFCLLFLRPELVRHLMFHELCHTRVMSHSRKYWALLESFQPDYRELERELDKGWMQIPAWVGLH